MIELDHYLGVLFVQCTVVPLFSCFIAFAVSAASLLQLFKRRNVATAEESGAEVEGMSDSGFLESQVNNMDMISVSKPKCILLSHLHCTVNVHVLYL